MNTKNKGNKKMEKEIENKPMTLDEIGETVQRDLDAQFDEWGNALEFRFVMSSQSYRAKQIGMDVGKLSHELEKAGYIKIVRTPKGQKFVFSGKCPLTKEEMQNWLQEQEIMKESQKKFKKQLKAQA